MEYLIGIIVALLGGFFYQNSKRKTAEARNENLDTKEKLNDIEKDRAKNSGLLESEEEKRKELEKEAANAKVATDTIVNIVNFFNNRKK